MKFFSRGKLLITGEYLVLKGAAALAMPLKKAQSMQVIPSSGDVLTWESRQYGEPWFRAVFRKPFFEVAETTDEKVAENLVRHFRAMTGMKPKFEEVMYGRRIITDLGFDRQWGFGSSSSLVSNLAYWAGLDPFRLHRKLSEGSGYDVVCAREDGPVFFTLRRQTYKKEEVDLPRNVTRHLFFVYLGAKQDSSVQVKDFLASKKAYRVEKRMVTALGYHMANALTIEDFGFYMKEHEQVISSILRVPPIKEGIFSDLPGEAKSLGAWGGDFAMLTWKGTRAALKAYLANKGLDVFFSYNELIKVR